MALDETQYHEAPRPRGLLAAAAAVSLALAGMFFAAACGDGSNASDGRVQVVTSIELLADLTRNAGGDRVDVRALLAPGADPHTFELPPDRVADIVRADVLFLNGLGLEASIEDIVRNNAGGPVVELPEGLPVIEGGEDEHAGGNPHLWLDVRHASRYVERIRDELTDVDPEGGAQYESNAAAYLEELGALDREIEAAVEGIPPERRKLVTFHDAFPYFASRYGLEIVAVAVPSPGQEPSARDIAELADTLRSERVPAVFKEPQFDARVLELAADDAGVRVLDLLSDAFTDEVDSYVELMRFDVRQLQEGLGGG